MNDQRPSTSQFLGFLVAFFVVWTLRATVLYSVDESIASTHLRTLFACGVKLLLWVVPAVLFAIHYRGASPSEYLGLSNWPSSHEWRVCLGGIALFLLLVTLGETVFGNKALSTSALFELPVGLGIIQLALSPLVEEVLFRGLILRELLAILPRWRSAVVNALLFVAIHLPFWIAHVGMNRVVAANAVGVFIFSLVAGWSYARTRSIWPPTIAHIANNLLAASLILHHAP